MHRPTEPGAPVARRIRGTVLVGFSALLTAVGHLAGGGSLPDLALLAVLLPALAWPVVAVADRCRGPVATAAVLGGGQFLLHQLMVTTHEHHAAAPAVNGATAMLAMHAAVTLVTVVGLRYADRGLAAVGAALRRVVPRRPVLLLADRPLPALAVPAAEPTMVSRLLADTQVRRGPPVRC